MLVNSKKMLESARINKMAIAHFNINNLEWTKYILEKCNELNTPVILGVSEGAKKYMGGFKVVKNMVEALIEELEIYIDVALHLDHGQTFESCKEAIDAGFTSVMIDASRLPLEENIETTKRVVEYAHNRGVTVEAEVGKVGGEEDGVVADIYYAEVADCVRFVEETKVDSLAPALGSVHGQYKGLPNLNFERMKEISELVQLPLVLHGGSGIPDFQIKEAISCGTTKINVNTELQMAWHDAVVKFVSEQPSKYDPRKVISSGEKALKDAVLNKVELFRNK